MQVILYKASCESIGPNDGLSSSEVIKKWVYVGSVRAHTHDVRALTVAVPISREGVSDFVFVCCLMFLFVSFKFQITLIYALFFT